MSKIPKRRILDSVDFPTPNQNVLEFMLLNESPIKEFKKFNRFEKKIEFKIKHNLGKFSNLAVFKTEMEENFKKILEKHLNNSDKNDYFSVAISHEDLGVPIYVAEKLKNLKYHQFSIKLKFLLKVIEHF